MTNAQSVSPSAAADDISPSGNAGPAPMPKMRKRTKTGCLTCRKRRIKCGEERPTCANCIKSKRECEGYNQRVIFRPPIGDWPNHPGVVSTIQYHTSMLPGTRNQPYQGPEPNVSAQESMLASIQPRPINNFDFSHGDPTGQQAFVGGNHRFTRDQTYQQPLQSPLHQQPLPSPNYPAHMHTPTTSYFSQPSPVHTSPPAQFNHERNPSYPTPLQYTQGSSYPPVSVPYDGHLAIKEMPQSRPQQSTYQQSYQPNNQQDAEGAYPSHSSISPRSDCYPQYAEPRPGLQRFNSHPQVPIHASLGSSAGMTQTGPYNLPAAVSHADFSHSSYSSVQIPIHDMSPDVRYMPQHALAQPIALSQARKPQPQLLLSGFGGDDHLSPTQALDEAAIENADDDYWDVQSDEEMFDVEAGEEQDALLTNKEFNDIRRIHLENSNELGIRRYDAFLYDGLLSQYRPEYVASPLRNPKTARVFAHYVHVTGPTISVYERNSRNPTLIFEGTTPPAQRGLWTHILPLKALSHQGLLHAMLAFASLHIARLQGASITPSYKHYAYSLKRLMRSLAHPKKRLTISTLATSILLATYEVWTAEHAKWSTHLVGAQRLITELDFRSLTREARRLRAAQTAMERQFPYQNPEMLIDQRQFDKRLNERTLMPDEGLVSTIVGKQVSYDDFGMVFEDNGARHDKRENIPAKMDLPSFETLQDLYWSYARHDMYQSIVSGHHLMRPFRKWSDCPPRAPLGHTDALYGSQDHLLLLLARVADFTARDRERKLHQVDADGGWRPRPGMPGFGSMGPPPSHQRGQPPTPTTPSSSTPYMQGPPSGWKGPPPPGFGPSSIPPGQPSQARQPPSATPNFYGMAPAPEPPPILSSYDNPNYKHSPPTSHMPHPRHANLPALYETALSEWEAISDAHAHVTNVLERTDSFAPLPGDLYPPAPGGSQDNGNATPFGPAIIHRSYDISVIWTLLHLAKIILIRAHPAMPPAAQMAAGVATAATAPYCQLIGRINAGMQIPVSANLSPFLGAVLVESTMPLFFAGITFSDAAQREWLVTRLMEIDKRTGWASAGIIARGCEKAWETAAEMGRGPPYERRLSQIRKEEEEEMETGDNVQGRDEGRAEGMGGRREEQGGVGETRFVVKRPLTFAMNLLGTEEDLREGMERVGL
ncbi:hypothetical protein BDW02DRAFT_422751 [Decorospora gaudefroyi]|uniref:Zn(2)-C6 fungal-type domain-containing protein n=1 Tax=Decorospora gaudefroyi TaxID=184978 RepID=A0A6A5KGN8_9PLEO|nr:hypothetical protein BDW02DRAFT_422751 [Decorospora gaudefroyi]